MPIEQIIRFQEFFGMKVLTDKKDKQIDTWDQQSAEAKDEIYSSIADHIIAEPQWN